MEKWISVKDKLPSVIGFCLGYNKNTIYWLFFNSDKKWCFKNSFITITHWMPLPSSPENKIINELKPYNIGFGDYVKIEQHRYGAKNEMYEYKVIRRLKSNSYVDVPIKGVEKETLHNKIVEVLACVCCGVSEREILNYDIDGCKKILSKTTWKME